MTAPMLSVVIPVRAQTELVLSNVERLATAVPPIQLVIVENGSQELSVDRLRERAGHHDLRLLRRAAPDLSAARNAGLEVATGRFLLFLDADDIVNVAMLLRVIEEIPGTVDAVHVAMRRLPERDAALLGEAVQFLEVASRRGRSHPTLLTGSEFLLRELLSNRYSPVTGAYLFRRSWLLGLDVRFAVGFLHEDHAFVTRVLASADQVAAFSEVALHKFERSDSIMRTMRLEESIAGYARAAQDLRASSIATDPRPVSRVAVVAVRIRLEHVLARKQLQLALGLRSRTVVLDRSIDVVAASARFAVMMLFGAVTAACIRLAACARMCASTIARLVRDDLGLRHH